MQALYAVSFDVQSAQEPGHIHGRLRRHLADWLGDRGRIQAPTEAELGQAGRAVLTGKAPGYGDRTVSWEVAGDERTRALRVTIRQPLPDGAAQFVTRVTVHESEEGGGGLRVVMGREIPDGWIAPVQDPRLMRPNILRAVLADSELDVRVLGQVATGRYERIREQGHAAVLSESLAMSTRLPILMVHPRDDAGWAMAAEASGQLAGLAQVVTLNYVTAQAIRRVHAQVAVPSGGARLVWPNLALEHPAYSREEVSQASCVASKLMPSLAQLSVIARGSDTAWETARQATYRAAARRSAAQLSRAQATGDKVAEVEALTARTLQLEEDAKFWEDTAQGFMDERDKAQTEAAAAEGLRLERDEWRKLYLDLSKGAITGAVESDPWSEIPVLDTDATATFEALTRTSENHIVFTPNAVRVWKACRYPEPQEMTDQLVTLAQAAIDLYTTQSGKMPRMDQWFYDNHGLKFANSDEKLSKNKALRYFEFDDKRRDGLPHIKVRDAVKPNEVGRIYFAFDSGAKRLIVNHVGLHL
ncbi:hypothetical protein [Streptomyces sp. AMCC400023]|uniref:hypothetical protein n=1 Tax=Streptomyces sp. AMCC400023 TaxID=2056258 RepID=UPI001F4280E9|nr:hypothetical protein [Streptomyces sp. AMCC400023]UJV39750.1 hypothetical protein CVT30_07620 [Streptomyces sp. AMCC400023]